MATSALYSFKSECGEYHIYQHWDGDPVGAAEAIENALKYAWALPRFETGEFAAAFCAANKPHVIPAGLLDKEDSAPHGGRIRLLPSGPWRAVAPDRIEYRYVVYAARGEIHVDAYELTRSRANAVRADNLLFSGSLRAITEWAKTREDSDADRPLPIATLLH